VSHQYCTTCQVSIVPRVKSVWYWESKLN